MSVRELFKPAFLSDPLYKAAEIDILQDNRAAAWRGLKSSIDAEKSGHGTGQLEFYLREIKRIDAELVKLGS